MTFFNIFKKKSKENVHEVRKKAIGEIYENLKDVKLEEIQEMQKRQPNQVIWQNVKNKEEFQFRWKISGLAALMAGGDIEFTDACKEIIECADKGLKINPNSAYLLYFRGRSKADIGQLKEGLEDLNKAIKIKKDYADAFVERGLVKRKIGDSKSAEKDYAQAKMIEPNIEIPE